MGVSDGGGRLELRWEGEEGLTMGRLHMGLSKEVLRVLVWFDFALYWFQRNLLNLDYTIKK